jgi:hypothetical protein
MAVSAAMMMGRRIGPVVMVSAGGPLPASRGVMRCGRRVSHRVSGLRCS